MASYGVFVYNDKGVETSAIDGRSFFLDSIQISGANKNGSKSYPSVNLNIYNLIYAISGSGGTAGEYIHAKVNGNTISWTSVVGDVNYITGYIFVCLVEK
ncbi:hypothetical protein [Hafnia paralvei]|uniref:hypothetical protein n=1 Tax=Hafnia paralvei TaxID=546367 RepID=UPI0039AFC978